jgi:hypothetical protein
MLNGLACRALGYAHNAEQEYDECSWLKTGPVVWFGFVNSNAGQVTIGTVVWRVGVGVVLARVENSEVLVE